MTRKLMAYARAQTLVAFSYPIEVSLGVLNVFATIILFFFLTRYVLGSYQAGGASSASNYFTFVVVGVLVSTIYGTWLIAFSTNVRELQATGALEMLLTTPTSAGMTVTGVTLYSLFLGIFHAGAGLVASVLFFGFRVDGVAWLPLAAALTLGGVTYLGIGLISASFVLAFRRGNPVVFVFDKLSMIMGGVYYPVAAMPRGLAEISNCLPLKHILEVVRLSLTPGTQVGLLDRKLAILTALAFGSLAVGIVVLKTTMRLVLVRGTLAHYW